MVLPFQYVITPTSDKKKKSLVTDNFTLYVSTASDTNVNKDRQKVIYET